MSKKEMNESDILKGGSSDNMTLIDIAKKHDKKGYYHIDDMVSALEKQLKMGIKDEMEHTDNPKIAREIAMDHLLEDPTYYTKIKKIEADEQTMADASGSFEAPMGGDVIKRKIGSIHNSEQEVGEATDASSSGAYDTPFGNGGKNPLRIDGVKSIMKSRAVVDKKFPKWGGPGGTFVKINDKCKKFPYCNQGSPKALQFYESKGLSESVMEVSKKYGLPYNDVKKIVLNEITEIFIKYEKEKMVRPAEMNIMINEILENEARKIIEEQMNGSEENLVSKVEGFQSLAGLVDNITSVENIEHGVLFTVDNITQEELTTDCGGSTFGESIKNLMQGLHHDLEDAGMGDNYDVDVRVEGEDNTLALKIKITTNKEDLLGATEMKEDTKQPKKECTECGKKTNVDEKAKLILGGDKQICSECGGKLTEGECSECNAKSKVKKNSIKMTETNMKKMIQKIIQEVKTVPGVEVTKKNHTASGKENKSNLSDVTDKIKKYLSFEGNDNPEFPKQIGKGEKVARQNTSKEDETVEANRGRGMQDLNYDQEPSEQFKTRLKMSLEGDSKTGNSQDAANVVKSDTGKNKFKQIAKKQKVKKEEPLYNRVAVPVDTSKKTEVKEEVENTTVLSEIKRMKEMFVYNRNSQ